MPLSGNRTLSLLFMGFGLLILLFFGAILWLKVPPAKPDNVYAVTGQLEKYRFYAENGDLQFRLQGDDHHYYVNHDKVDRIDRERLKEVFDQGLPVEVIVFKTRWNPLDPDGNVRPVAALHCENDPILDWNRVAVR